MEDIVPTIFAEMSSDDENASEDLLAYYDAASPEERGAMDMMCMYLCDWRFESILKKCGLR
ncbi:hypothetical protein GCM10023321_26240 [Pseudonocardia eucalypti]|uniref:Uncharacterized protein n=1 Tax=Pseudonocardia eucalypti TaxID=648755 RepID=A0ABP9PZ18_9PSEU|nr:hypothetical protein [Pseudonocardia eucalypti]